MSADIDMIGAARLRPFPIAGAGTLPGRRGNLGGMQRP